jgi:Protein of unknown function VcgC/VcgE (DUF2780)
MKKRMVVLAALLLPMLCSCSSAPSAPSMGGATDIVSGLTKSLGVTESQAAGGVGSVLTLAQEKLVAGDFDKIAAVIPGSQKYLDMAKSLGAVTGPIGNAAGLNSALGKLGISPATASKFVPAVTDFVGKAGGKDVGKLLSSALGS